MKFANDLICDQAALIWTVRASLCWLELCEKASNVNECVVMILNRIYPLAKLTLIADLVWQRSTMDSENLIPFFSDILNGEARSNN